jgi:hypothetical protein
MLDCSEVLDGISLLFFLPEGEVLLEKLDDGLGISEGLLINVVDLFKGVGQSFLTKFAGLLVVVHNLVMEHGEVKSKTKSDWVASIQTLGLSLGELIVFEGSIFNCFDLVLLGALGNVPIVITNHFVKESLGLVSGGNLHALTLNNLDDGHALVVKLTFDLLLVLGETVVELRVFWVLLDSADGSNSGSLRSNLVLKSNRQKVSLLSCEVLAL